MMSNHRNLSKFAIQYGCILHFLLAILFFTSVQIGPTQSEGFLVLSICERVHFLCLCHLFPVLFTIIQYSFIMLQHFFFELSSNTP